MTSATLLASPTSTSNNNNNNNNNNTSQQQLVVDDTQPLACFFQHTETATQDSESNANGTHIDYLMRVQRGHDTRYTWLTRHRYSHFLDLYTQHLKQCGLELPMPPKKTFGNMRPEFLQQRQQALQEFINRVLASHFLGILTYKLLQSFFFKKSRNFLSEMGLLNFIFMQKKTVTFFSY